jgi:hypothetical protein
MLLHSQLFAHLHALPLLTLKNVVDRFRHQLIEVGTTRSHGRTLLTFGAGGTGAFGWPT